MSISTDGFGTILSGLISGGGGGGVVIPDDGNVSGPYTASVICEGNVTVTGPLEVFGSMVVRGGFINNGGYPVTIHGDLFAQGVYFNKADTATPQSNFSVDGDFLFTYLEFRQCGGEAAQLRVGGDLTGATGIGGTYLDGSGETPGTPGLNILVYGDVTVAYINISGAYGDTSAAGNGGSVYIYGDLKVVYGVYADGGDGSGYDAGSGGGIEVYGAVSSGYAEFSVRGGDASDGNGGQGGFFECSGQVNLGGLYLDGGSCNSTDETLSARNGGEVYIYGNVNLYYLSACGGSRFGTLSVPGTLASANGGYIEIHGDVYVGDSIDAQGGNSYTNLAAQPGGNGGSLYAQGNLTVNYSVYLNGGYAQAGAAGSGGEFVASGNACVVSDMELNGGDSSEGSGGSGSTFVECLGDLNVGYLGVYGGDGVNGGSGWGGGVEIDGTLVLRGNADFMGGYCTSADEAHQAGGGGALQCGGLKAWDSTLDLSGGNRAGATSVLIVNSSANGGYLYVLGDATVGNVYAAGGDVTTSYPNAPGGLGGQFAIAGSGSIGGYFAYGGSSTGLDGGKGGQFYVANSARLGTVNLVGGASYDSEIGSDAAVNGAGGFTAFGGGVVVSTIYQNDGAGSGSAPTDSTEMYLQGHCCIGTLEMTSRTGCKIYGGEDGLRTTLQVNSMPTKQTLNNGDGSETTNIGTQLESGTFISGSLTWYCLTGTPLV